MDSSRKQTRRATIVILVTAPVWLAVSWLGGRIGWDRSYFILADLAAMAAFLWAMVVLFLVWRKGRKDEG